MTFLTVSLGCKVNSYENSALREIFLSKGFKDDNKNPDIVLINTCSVTSVADQKSRQIIRRYAKKFPSSILVVMGCFAQKNAEVALNCGANIVVGTSNRDKIPSYIEQFIKDKKNIVDIDEDVRHLNYESFHSFALPDSTRAYIKIEDGCNNFCTYCTIPYTRGNARSRAKDEIIDEIKYLIKKGFKEFVLTGIHTAHYGVDLKDVTFSDLVEEILNIEGLYRLRISSIEESEIDDKLIGLFASYENLASHLHMPLQSGCAKTLKAMGRKYNVDDFLKKVSRIREVRPDIAITTDVIVGFPNEIDEDFEETYEFIKRVNFSELHVFPFSRREGTKAYDMDNQIDPSVKAKRVERLITLSNELYKSYYSKFIGQEFEVILEERNRFDNKLYGFTSNYLKLGIDLPDSYIGKIQKVKVE